MEKLQMPYAALLLRQRDLASDNHLHFLIESY